MDNDIVIKSNPHENEQYYFLLEHQVIYTLDAVARFLTIKCTE